MDLQQATETQTLDTTQQVPEASQQQPTDLPKTEANVAPSLDKAPVAAYTPDFKFKANNKEHEIPEMLRSIIKSEKEEKYLKDIYQKAYGIEPIKERMNAIRGEYQQLQQAHHSVMEQIGEARTAYQRGDMDTVFDTLKISPEKVLQWAVEKVQLSQMPPEQRQAIEAKRMAEQRAYQLEKQSSYSEQQAMEQQAQYLGQMLELVLERPDFNAVAQAYDSRKATQGAFRELVIKVGQSEHALTGKVLSPLEAAQKAMEWIGEVPKPAQPAAPAAPAQTATATQATNIKKPNTLPNLANAGARSGSAPAKSKMKSLDDIKKVYDQKYGPTI